MRFSSDGDDLYLMDFDVSFDCHTSMEFGTLTVRQTEGTDPLPSLQLPTSFVTIPKRVESVLNHTNRQPHHSFGQGIEAARTARYRRKDLTQSRMFRFLQSQSFYSSIANLMNLIEKIRDWYPHVQRPLPPSRTQKRSRNGLIEWLDVHETLALAYFRALGVDGLNKVE
jgi:hypothetical protein